MICINCQLSLRLHNPRAIPSHRTSRSLLHLGTLSPPSILPSGVFPPLYTSEPCLTHRNGRSLMALTHQRSRAICTFRRRQISLEFSSARFFTVRPRSPPTRCPPLLTPFLWFIPGMAIVLSFKCMAALFNPVYRRGEPIKWGLVSFTMVMFSVATIGTAMNLNVRSIMYIDNREYPGAGGVILPGPLGYRWFISTSALTIIPNTMLFLTSWLGDGLLVGSSFGAAAVHPSV